MRDKCLRTVLISSIEAPDLSSARVASCFSNSVRFLTGAIQLAEAPPEIRTSTRSSDVAASANNSVFSAAARPAASGTGCPAGGEYDQAPVRWRRRQVLEEAGRRMRRGDRGPEQLFEKGPLRHLNPGR